jgi:fatty acid CoA ligase FadD9
MSTSAMGRDARRQRRFNDLTSTDEQFVAARPDPAVSAALDVSGMLLADVISTVMDGYGDRPALGQRAVEFGTAADGRTVATLQPRFDTLTYRETWRRFRALVDALANNPV